MNKSIELRTAARYLPEQFPSAKNAMFSAAETLEAAEARAAELTAQLAAVTKERDRFADELAARGYKPRCTCTMDDNMHEPQCAITEWARLRFERTAPLDWRDAYDGETPLGIALDGLGDEVE